MYLRKAPRHPHGRCRHSRNNGEEHRAESVCHRPTRIERSSRRIEDPEEYPRNHDKCGQCVQTGFPTPEDYKPYKHCAKKYGAREQVFRHDKPEHDDEYPGQDSHQRIKFLVPDRLHFFITPDFLISREMISPITVPNAHTATTATLIPIAMPGFAPINALTAIPVSSVTV